MRQVTLTTGEVTVSQHTQVTAGHKQILDALDMLEPPTLRDVATA